MRPAQLVTITEVEDGTHTIGLVRELDFATAPTLEEAISRACADGAEHVVLDLSGLDFMDSTGRPCSRSAN